MIGALIHIVLNTALVVVLAVIATIVFVIAWPFWYIRRRRAREPAPPLGLFFFGHLRSRSLWAILKRRLLPRSTSQWWRGTGGRRFGSSYYFG